MLQVLNVSPGDDDAHLLIGRALGMTYRRENKTEPYVCIPPAFLITDSDGATWTLGFKYRIHNGEYEFIVLRDDVEMGEFAKRIEYRRGVVRIFNQDGWKVLARSRTTFI
jgi:hypothetical protein